MWTDIKIERDGNGEKLRFYGYIPRTEMGKEVHSRQNLWESLRGDGRLQLTQESIIKTDNYQITGRLKVSSGYTLQL